LSTPEYLFAGRNPFTEPRVNPVSRFAFRHLAPFAVSILAAGVAGAATYLPLSDEALAARSPVIVRARVLGQETRIATVDGATAVTVTRFRTLEVIKGEIASETFRIELPGGVAGEVATWVPGTPSFAAQSEVLLFLSPTTAGDDAFSLTEFGLSKFDIVEDRAHRRFAVRTVFRAEEDDSLALGEKAPPPSAEGPRPLRDADSFAASLASDAISNATVSMRKVSGGCYSSRTFRTAVLHELGHTLGLGHPDQTTSIHSTTASSDWASAAMTSSVPSSQPSAPQADDIQAILWYYGSGAPPQAGIPDRPRPALSTRRPIH
jgi:hypothetical protein